MKNLIVILCTLFLGITTNAQFSKASLQASGLTCSMCSKAVLTALQGVPFVEKVQVDIKNQQYNISFKQDVASDFDLLSKAVEDAGFSVASFSVTAFVDDIKIVKDTHITVGGKTLHFLSGNGKQLSGKTTFTLVDKGFLSAKDFKKYTAASQMKCVQTGKAENCCTKTAATTASARVYHAII